MARPVELRTVMAEVSEHADLSALVSHLVDDGGVVSLQDGKGHELSVPPSVSRLVYELARELGAGNAVTIVPTHAELTTQQAADLLNVSRPYLVRLLEAKDLPSAKVGTHRRVLLADVLEYRRHREQRREVMLQRMSEHAEESGLEY